MAEAIIPFLFSFWLKELAVSMIQLNYSISAILPSPRGGEGPQSGVEGGTVFQNSRSKSCRANLPPHPPFRHLLPRGEKEDTETN